MNDPLGITRTPDRPGPGPAPEALLRALDVVVRRRIEAMLTGDHRSSTIGIGTELAQIRLYQPGDDVRRIDWNVTARTGDIHVRDQIAERALVSWLVLDTSPSMSFGTADRRKADVAEGVALAVGHVGTRHGNRLGLITFGDAKPVTIPSRQGRAGLLGMLATVRREPQLEGGGATSLGEALARTGRLATQPLPGLRGQRLPRAARLAAGADRAGRPPRRGRGRDPRPARAGAARRRRAVAGRPRDRPPAAGRHQPAPAAGAVRRPPPPPSGPSWPPCSSRQGPTTSCCGRPATGCAASPGSCATG